MCQKENKDKAGEEGVVLVIIERKDLRECITRSCFLLILGLEWAQSDHDMQYSDRCKCIDVETIWEDKE